MDIDEQFLHQARRQIIKLTGNLLDSKKNLALTFKSIALVASHSPTTEAIQQNILALADGLMETVKLCGIAAEEIKAKMKDPDAIPPPISAACGKFRLTPMQRQLATEGVVFDTLPEFEPTKTERRIAKLLPFKPKLIVRKNRRKSKDNPPL